ncbi:MAG: terpene cyclase/mutase family protein, partial [Pirellulales bacterium]|nr:terpene cyclase/mutase family protein [Pirellulales bacterium]
LVKAINLILAAQKVPKSEKLRGGWRYSTNSRDSDLSVSVWQLMALRSAKNDGLDVPGEAIEKALAYLRHSYTSPLNRDGSLRDKVSGFSYTPGTHHPTFTMTAAGLLAMQVCGQYDSPLVKGASEWLLQHPPKHNERFFHYGIYYYAQGMHQAGGKYSETADKLVPELLLEGQSTNGSWLARNGEERNEGTVYATSMSILSLSVRYHYLPIYQR